MSNKDKGGPAFPCEIGGTDEHGEYRVPYQGMTLRDYFAAKAMQALIASPRIPAPANHGGTDITDVMVADLSYKMAEAMLEARKE